MRTINLSNFTNPTNHLFFVDNYPELTYAVTDFTMPDITIGRMEMATPWLTIKKPGTSLDMADFVVTFIVDEQLTCYKTLAKWAMSLKQATPLTVAEVAATKAKLLGIKEDLLCDCALFILSNNKNYSQKIVFHDCFPTSLSNLVFSTRSGIEPLIADASFTFTYMEFE